MARALAAAGAGVVVNPVVRPEDTARPVAELKRLGVTAMAVRADVSHDDPLRPDRPAADIGEAVAWLVSDDADCIHGRTIFGHGGMTLYSELARGG